MESAANSSLQQLLQIADLDKDIVACMRDDEEIPELIAAEQQRLEAGRAALHAAEEELKTLRKEQAVKELDLKTFEGEIQKLDKQLNVIKKNDEYAAVKGQIAKLKDAGSKLEEEILLSLERVEERNKALAQIKRELADVEKEVNATVAELTARRNKALAQMQQLDTRKTALLEHVDMEMRDKYLRLFKRMQDQVIVPVVNGICQGCNMQITPQDASRVMAGTQVIYCKNCGCILYRSRE